MSEHDKDKMAEVDNIEIEPLTDDALESVAGGTSDGSSGSCCSCCACSTATPVDSDALIAASDCAS